MNSWDCHSTSMCVHYSGSQSYKSLRQTLPFSWQFGKRAREGRQEEKALLNMSSTMSPRWTEVGGLAQLSSAVPQRGAQIKDPGLPSIFSVS